LTSVDLLIVHARILCMDAAGSQYNDGAVACNAGRIVAVGETNELERQYVAARTLHARGKLLMPGFINAHTHVAMAYFKGLADDLLLQAWLQDHIWPAEGRLLNDSFVYDASLHGAAEMLRGGTTTFCDMYFFEAATARACADIGIRAHLGEGVLSFPVHGHAGAADEIAYNVRNAAQHGPDDLIRFELAPHAIYTCNEADLRAVAEASQQHNLRVHIHLSETQGEVDDCQKQHGKRPVHYLNELGLVNERLSIAHGVWLDDSEAELLAARGAAVALCARSNLKLASGFAPVKLYERHGVRLTLGTDGVASNNTLSMFEEMSLTARLHKTLNNDPTFLSAERMVRMATCNAAKALGRNDLGSLEPGKRADMILIDLESIEAAPVYNLYSHLVYTLCARDVTDVFVNGRQVLQDRRLTQVDERELLERARRYRGIVLQ